MNAVDLLEATWKGLSRGKAPRQAGEETCGMAGKTSVLSGLLSHAAGTPVLWVLPSKRWESWKVFPPGLASSPLAGPFPFLHLLLG